MLKELWVKNKWAIIIIALCLAYIGFGEITSRYKLGKLEKEKEMLQAEKDEIIKEREAIKAELNQTIGRIQVRETELKDAKELLAASAKDVLKSRTELDKLTADYNRLNASGDGRDLSKSEIIGKLCQQFPNERGCEKYLAEPPNASR